MQNTYCETCGKRAHPGSCTQAAIGNVSCCFAVKGTDSNGNAWLYREFIWPSCDSAEHRRYLKSLMQQKADRMNKAGATVYVEYQELNDKGLWETTPEEVLKHEAIDKHPTKSAIEAANAAQPAMVGFKRCGCCVAVDLDAHIGTKLEWKRKGYEIRMMQKTDAIALLKSSLCLHR